MVKLSKTHTKFIKSLQLKKYRQSEQAFLVEGEKSVLEVLASDFEVSEVIVSPAFLEKHAGVVGSVSCSVADDLSGLGTFKSNNQAIAVVRMKPNAPPDRLRGLILVSDGINDPGNLGTILRIADWYGISAIIASPDTCELYNPKVISASKGSFTRVPVYYAELPEFLAAHKMTVLAADMRGEDVHSLDFPENGFLILGSEAHGISPELESLVDKRVHIPSYGGAESLNVGVAAAIIIDNYRRRH